MFHYAFHMLRIYSLASDMIKTEYLYEMAYHIKSSEQMAKFLKGIHGAYTGKVGNVVSSSWRNEDVKSLRKQRNPCCICNNKKRFRCDSGNNSSRKKRYSHDNYCGTTSTCTYTCTS